MRKYILLIASLAMAFSSGAVTISPDQALSRALDSEGMQKIQSKDAPYRLVQSGEYRGRANYYVFSNGSSSVILSAEDFAVPVLGYLDRAVTDATPLPPQLKWWLNDFGAEVNHALGHQAPAGSLSTRRIARGVAPRRTQRHAVNPLLTTTWNQLAPYNQYIPEGYPTGCVATAMAQIMNYYQYPDKGTGKCQATVDNATRYSLTLDDYPFNWAEMLDDYPSSDSGTEAQRDAVATLMIACGFSVGMNYAENGSGASSWMLVPAFVNNFKYDRTALYEAREYYAPEAWEDKVYDEVAAGRPLIYSGRGSDGGHEFVCDGYSAGGYFHFNWGWGGAYDGYFKLTSLVPEGMGTGGNSDGFTSDQDAVFNLQRPVAGSKEAAAWLCVLQGEMQGGLNGNDIILAVNDGFIMANISGIDFTVDIGYGLTDASGNETYYAIELNTTIENLTGRQNITAEIPRDLADGSYRIYPAYRRDGSWTPVRVTYGHTEYISFTKADGSISIGSNFAGSPSDLEYSDYAGPEKYYPGTAYSFSLTITNPTGATISAPLAGGVFLPEDNTCYIVSDYGFQTVALAPGESRSYTFSGTVNSDLDAGEYFAGICDESTIYWSTYIQVEEKPSEPDPEPTAVDLQFSGYDGPSEIVAGEPYSFDIDITNPTEASLRATLGGGVYMASGNSYIPVADISNRTVFLSAGQTKHYTFTGTAFADLEPGIYVIGISDDSYLYWHTDILVKESEPDVAVSEIEADDSEAVYYNMQGIRVNNPRAGIYIMMKNGKASKVTIP